MNIEATRPGLLTVLRRISSETVKKPCLGLPITDILMYVMVSVMRLSRRPKTGARIVETMTRRWKDDDEKTTPRRWATVSDLWQSSAWQSFRLIRDGFGNASIKETQDRRENCWDDARRWKDDAKKMSDFERLVTATYPQSSAWRSFAERCKTINANNEAPPTRRHWLFPLRTTCKRVTWASLLRCLESFFSSCRLRDALYFISLVAWVSLSLVSSPILGYLVNFNGYLGLLVTNLEGFLANDDPTI